MCLFQYKVGDFKNCACVCVYFSLLLTSVPRALCDAALIICGTVNMRVPRDDWRAERRSEDTLVPEGAHIKVKADWQNAALITCFPR